MKSMDIFSGTIRNYRRSVNPVGSILMFHAVRLNEKEKSLIPINADLEVTPEQIEIIIDSCKSWGYDIVSLDDAILRISTKSTKPFVCFTFDDGYLDNLTLALPVFEKKNVPFAIYVCTDFPNGKARLWWYLLEDLVFEKENICFNLNDNEYTFSLGNNEEKVNAFYKLRELILTCRSDDFEQLIEKLFSNGDVSFEELSKRLVLRWDELRILAKNPLVTIGAHTVTHAALSSLSEELAYKEILNSKLILEKELSVPIRHFCYPYGSPEQCGAREAALVKKCGFVSATTTIIDNIYDTHLNDPYYLPRIPIRGRYNDVFMLEWMMRGLSPGQVYDIESITNSMEQEKNSLKGQLGDAETKINALEKEKKLLEARLGDAGKIIDKIKPGIVKRFFSVFFR